MPGPKSLPAEFSGIAPYIVFDTETTGLPPRSVTPEEDLAAWPRLVQLAWVLVGEEEEVLEEKSLVVVPEGFEIPEASTNVHGITTDIARVEGVALPVVLWQFEQALEKANFFVGHNIGFDIGILHAAFLRAGLPSVLYDRQTVCTMRSGRDVCRLPGKGGFKNPRLEELHTFLLGTGFEGAHDALNDVHATWECFKEMVRRGDPILPAQASHPASDVLPEPGSEQKAALRAVETFLNGTSDAFVLSGAAGTGKTFLIAHLLRLLQEMDRPFQLMAPTGRAARVLTEITDEPARTIHATIFKYAGTEPDKKGSRNAVFERFKLKRNIDPEGTVYIVDEASMVADREGRKNGFLRFGSGRLLSDLIQYARILEPEQGNQIIFVGDPAQLPPVGSPLSPALSPNYLEENGLRTESAVLEKVVRQAAGSGILKMAHAVRSSMHSRMPLSLRAEPGERDVIDLPRGNLIDSYEKAVGKLGVQGVILITHTNRSAFILNRDARACLGKPEMRFVPGDRLLVVQNNYQYDLFNGDFVTIYEIEDHPEVRGPYRGVSLQFRMVSLLTNDGLVEARILENLLFRPDPRLRQEEVWALMADFKKRNPELERDAPEWNETIRQDPWLNALHVKPGYAVTCHKAQGGEWHSAFVLFENSGIRNDRSGPYRWTYTALTRAKRKLYLINIPGSQPEPVLEFPGMPELLPDEPLPSPGGRSSVATRGTLEAKWSVLLAGTDIYLVGIRYKQGTAKARFHLAGSEAELIFVTDAEGRFGNPFAAEGGDASLAKHLLEMWGGVA